MGNQSLLEFLFSAKGSTILITLIVVFAVVYFITINTQFSILILIKSIYSFILRRMSRFIGKKERYYHRDLAIGKINEKHRKVKAYRFLSELIIDLDLKGTGITPYQLLTLILVSCFTATFVTCKIVFDSIFMAIILFPVVTVGVICIMYTKGNIAHDRRIEAVIEAENIICNNIDRGVVVAVRESIDVIPKEVRQDFRDFLDNVEQKNYHIKTALIELNTRLGTVSDDFIKKAIVFELEEEHGIVGMFSDVVELNNIKMEMRTKIKRALEQVTNEFKIGAGMIIIFLVGVMFVFDNVAKFYLNTFIGNIIIAIDILIIIAEYVYITSIRAKEL